jgi:hypothetical protein
MQKLFQDPAWWMTAVVIALIVSVIANFITQAILKLLAQVSPHFRVWRERRQKNVLNQAEDLARDIGLVLYHYLWAISLLIVWSLCVTFALGFTILFSSMKDHSGISAIFIVVFFLVMFVFAFITQIKAIGAIRLAHKARRIYRQKLLPNN